MRPCVVAQGLHPRSTNRRLYVVEKRRTGMITKPVDCPICEKDNSTPLFKVGGLQLVRCSECAVTYYNPNISPEDHYAFLDETFYVSPMIQRIKSSGQKYNFDIYMNHVKDPSTVGYPDYLEPQHLEAKELWGKKVMNWFIKAWQDQKFDGVPSSILEMGCATGHMMLPFKEAEWTCVGQEVSSWIVEQSSKKVDVRLGELHQLPFSDKFNCVLAWDAFEHTQFPNKALKKIYESTTDQMLMVWQTPDVNHSAMQWHLWSPKQHAFFYNRETATKLLKKHGFIVLGEKISPEADEMILIITKDPMASPKAKKQSDAKSKVRKKR
jgi:hypothetical protein